jgi:hypothetical protein
MPPRIDPEPAIRPTPPPSLAGNSGNYAAVEQCKNKFFIGLELCLAEHCDKAGTRNHPLCVRRREEIRIREESKMQNR